MENRSYTSDRNPRKKSNFSKNSNKPNHTARDFADETVRVVKPREPREMKATPEGVFTTLIPELQRALGEEGYKTPTPIQEGAIPHLIEGRDIIGCAQTGTGKTAAFTLPILQFLSTQEPKVTTRPKCPKVLVLAPTRELAIQIGASVENYGRHLPVKHTVIFGGVNQGPQVRKLMGGVDVLVATPGRLLDLMQQKHIFLDDVGFFVLDEADRMLDMGFIPDIRKIMKFLPERKQSLFFSATMEADVGKLARSLVHKPVYVTIEPDKPAVERIEQKIYFLEKKTKDTLLRSLIKDHSIKKAIVFTQMKHMANKVVERLEQAGVSASAIHGNKSQAARTKALDGFKQGKVSVLVATDIAARGIDVDNITHVINYDLPNEPETYVHRIGRTARAGAEGVAFSFCAAEERSYLKCIEALLRKPIPVVSDHPYHSDFAQNATGSDAKPAPKSKQSFSRSKGKGYAKSKGGRDGRFSKSGFERKGHRR